MEDYPRTLEEFEGLTEQACREYLMQLRWPQGFRCPRCEGQRTRFVAVNLTLCCHLPTNPLAITFPKTPGSATLYARTLLLNPTGGWEGYVGLERLAMARIRLSNFQPISL